jgi:hypothetical protein
MPWAVERNEIIRYAEMQSHVETQSYHSVKLYGPEGARLLWA